VPVISREWAVELVHRRLLAEGASADLARAPEPFIVVSIEQHELGWMIGYSTRRYQETGDFRYALLGNLPYFVDALDGSLHRVNPALEWVDEYREKVRGEIPPRELDVEVGRLVALGRRFDAFKEVRAAGDFGPVDARRYVDAIVAGMEPAPDLLARLPRRERISAVSTLSGPNPEPAG
jgi:hypothetical protein